MFQQEDIEVVFDLLVAEQVEVLAFVCRQLAQTHRIFAVFAYEVVVSNFGAFAGFAHCLHHTFAHCVNLFVERQQGLVVAFGRHVELHPFQNQLVVGFD